MNIITCTLCVIIYTCISLPIFVPIAFAENDKQCIQSLTLDEFRAVALNKTPLVFEIDSDYANNLAKAFNAEVLSNPEIEVEQTVTNMQLGGDDDPQIQISLNQPIRLSDFGARDKIASLMRKSGDTSKKAKLLELTQKLTLRFKTLYLLQESEKLISKSEDRANKKITLIKQGVGKGLIPAGDERLFEGEKYRLQAQQKGFKSAIAILQQEFSKSIGTKCTVQAIDDHVNFDKIPPLSVLLQKASASKFSETARIQLLENLSKEQFKLAELDAYPSITPRIIYEHSNDGGDFFGAGVSIPLPFWERNQGAIQQTRAKHKVLKKKEYLLTNGGFKSQVYNLRLALSSKKEQMELYFLKVIPSFDAALTAQEKFYFDGKGSVTEVWQTMRSLNDVQSEGLSLWLEAQSIKAELSLLIGEEI